LDAQQKEIFLDALENIGKTAVGFGIEAYQLFLFSMTNEQLEETLTETKIQDLLANSTAGRKKLMWRFIEDQHTDDFNPVRCRAVENHVIASQSVGFTWRRH